MGNLRLIAPYFRRSLPALAAGLLALTACDFGQMYTPLLVGGVIDSLAAQGASRERLLRPLALIVGIALSVALLRYAWRHLIYGFSRRMEKDLRARLYARFVSLSVTWHNRNSSGDLMAVATNDIESVRLAVGFGLVSLVDSVVLGTAAVVFMLSISPGLCLWAFLPLPLISILTAIFGRRIFDSFLETQNLFGALTEAIREHVSGFKVIRAMALEELAKAEIDREGMRYLRRNVRLSFVMGLFFPFLNLLANLAVALTLFFGGRAALLGEISPGEFVAFISYLGLLAWPLMAMGLTLGLIQQGLASLSRLAKVLRAEETLPHPPDPFPEAVFEAAGAERPAAGKGPEKPSGAGAAGKPGAAAEAASAGPAGAAARKSAQASGLTSLPSAPGAFAGPSGPGGPESDAVRPEALLPCPPGLAAALPAQAGAGGGASSPVHSPAARLAASASRASLSAASSAPALLTRAPADVSRLLRGGFSVGFSGVSYTYPGRAEKALADFSAVFDPCGFTALTGPTGSGKSTLASLLPALLEPDEGTILIGGVPSADYRLEDLRSLFGFVPQDGHIFTGTLLENIAFGKPEASAAEALAAAEAAGLAMDPRVFPQGLGTLVGEKGITLSGGQRQRAALARALLLDPPYLILDDTLSAVDANIEDEILSALGRLRRGRGTLIISHRVTSLRRAGTFLVLEKGVLTASGSFAELAERPGYFKRIVDLASLGKDPGAGLQDQEQNQNQAGAGRPDSRPEGRGRPAAPSAWAAAEFVAEAAGDAAKESGAEGAADAACELAAEEGAGRLAEEAADDAAAAGNPPPAAGKAPAGEGGAAGKSRASGDGGKAGKQ
ncbi:MAG: ATP-binding cassette domain-containing protein [Deltaproteobacteria bacterium]|jgi:ABC-type multidrug transport system fused ATPase/permease subunit|nr:ATP-binding cassette domain-containing protein [Deltaproteobacteria bacterium]